ncbi:GNAT family N-acetyltransferase [Actinoplanes sp. ATCC 53533]|uniref:bifunctional acetate--CoA ligase family protein/GNAT family N-acetyltransferase n=1 Tax=Actinoplanes sp. ATCC 53533 TaxID=1288362 RepID=UPI000F79FC87|nr:bifunctional GNAT family N-acetyltransferase/acetate--CoA ligase family protein [Actinoplanes sp. ATCC 53533]RSM49354.1 GNAT family N-acetyltransferase [Actinoplanes sp. ATCC 53533]
MTSAGPDLPPTFAITTGDPAEVDALTADGGIVTIRPIRAGDRGGLAALYADASPESLRLRFFARPSSGTLTAEVDRLCRPADDRHLAVVAALAGTPVGVASCERTSGTDRRAEFSVFVAGPHRGRGIGTLLLEHLAARAHTHGITELIGEVLPGNMRMLRVARDLSGRIWSRFDDGIVDVGLKTNTDESVQLAVDVRDRVAERASLRPVLSPASVAVVGAGRRPGGVGHETLLALREYGYTGRLYAVNRAGASVDGVAGYRSVRDLPPPVDLVVIAVPADQVTTVLADAAAVGVRGAVVLSSGFGEDGPQGRRRQHDLLRLARTQGIRLIGPNCLGVVNTDPLVRLNASFAPTVPPAGGLAVAAQSGAVAIALLDGANRHGYGISTLVSLGNKADVSGNDLIAYWYDDPATHAVALYLESFGNPRKFARTVRALSRRKPVLAIKSGRTRAGQRAGTSHTAAAAAPAATVDALFAQAGVIRTDTLGELLDAARILTDQPLAAGSRLAIVGNAGGLNVLAADAAEQHGLQVPPLSAAVTAALAKVAPGAAGIDNPVDLGAGASPAAFAATAATVAGSGAVDALLLIVIGTRANSPAEILAALGPIVDDHPELPVAAVLVGAAGQPAFGKRGVPIFDLPERAVTALAHAAAYAAWRREPLGRRPELTGVDAERAAALVREALAGGDGWQPYDRTAAILAAYGITILPATIAHQVQDAVRAADDAGYPVVLKSADPALVHKSDTGGVRLGLADADAVRGAYGAVAAAGHPGAGVLVQRQVSAPVELVAGLVHDRLFGSVVLLGLGGVRTDLFDDRVLRLVPLTDLDAGRMWRGLHCAPLLTGYRGEPPVDTAGLEDLLLRLGRLAEDLPEIAELDLNPVLAGPAGVVAVDAKLRLAPVGAEPDPALRRLRPAEDE